MSGAAPVLLERGPGALLGDELAAILAGRAAGVLVPGFLSPEACEAICRAARTAATPLDAAPFPGVTYGAVLVVSPPDLSRYRAAWAELRAALAPSGVQASFAATFQAMGARAVTPAGYAALTVRVLGDGQEVAVHSERSDWPSMRALAPLLDPATTLSFYVTLRAGEGGELVIYHRPPPGREPAIGGVAPERAHALLAAWGETRLRPGVGDLLVFDGGRFNHRVTPTRGERWTVGGFAARARGGAELLFWS